MKRPYRYRLANKCKESYENEATSRTCEDAILLLGNEREDTPRSNASRHQARTSTSCVTQPASDELYKRCFSFKEREWKECMDALEEKHAFRKKPVVQLNCHEIVIVRRQWRPHLLHHKWNNSNSEELLPAVPTQRILGTVVMMTYFWRRALLEENRKDRVQIENTDLFPRACNPI
jgi:hypothetical protein